jgi:1-acyl-sn-glycerol-3-phosphate acyltransferase
VILKTLWYYLFKILIKCSLFFYTKRILVKGKENIPKKGAILFVVNHPNGLIDPLIVAVNNPRVQHFLVRAASFKKPLIKRFLESLNLMPIYRMRDGVKQLGNNKDVFDKCFTLLNNQKALMIFPEGSHDKRRTVRTLSKGFSRIVFGALEQNPALQIHIIPVGLTYQNPSVYPSNVCLHYGSPILANDFYKPLIINSEIKRLKDVITSQLKTLCVHIPIDENYEKTLAKLTAANVDFTEVELVNSMITSSIISGREKKLNLVGFLKPFIILNSIIPWIIWKYTKSKIDEFEFIDTFRYGIGTITVSVNLMIQTYLASFFYQWILGLVYLASSLLLLLLYSKFQPITVK